MNKSTYILLIFIFLISIGQSIGQQYPVQASFLLKAPYPIYLSDYANPAGSTLSLQLLLKDQSQSGINVKLRFSIEGAGVSYSNLPNLIGVPEFTLIPNIPQRLSQADLAPYFKAENLIIAPNQYGQALPEGIYKFTVQVIDVLTNRIISKVEQSPPIWVVVNDPPLLNMPLNQSAIKIAEPQNILFQWTARHKQANAVEYEFTLTELLVPKNFAGNLQNMFLSQPAYYQTSTINTTLLYGPAQPPLIAGRVYGFRVKAKAKQGFEEVGLFRNEGYSEVFVFKYGEDNIAPKLLFANRNPDGQIELKWEGTEGNAGFEIHAKADDGSPTITKFDLLNLGNLQKTGLNQYSIKIPASFAKTYQIKIGGLSKIDGEQMLFSNELNIAKMDINKVKLTALTPDRNDYLGKMTGKSKKKAPTPLKATCEKPEVNPSNKTLNEIAKGDLLTVAGNQVEVISDEEANASVAMNGSQTNVKLYYSADFQINEYNEVITGFLSTEPTNQKIKLMSSSNETGGVNGLKNLGIKIDSVNLLGNKQLAYLVALVPKLVEKKSKLDPNPELEKLTAQLKVKDEFFAKIKTELQDNKEASKEIQDIKKLINDAQVENSKQLNLIASFIQDYSGVLDNEFYYLMLKKFVGL